MLSATHIRIACFLLLLFAAHGASARIGLVLGEPFGSFGTMMPQGHASVYLDNICADTPISVRPCQPGEAGVVVSRLFDLYHPNLDWLAMPAFTFFYGVERPEDVPASTTQQSITELRESYRRAHLREAVPDLAGKHGEQLPAAYGDWDESIGATFDRRVLLYVIDTTPEQDAAILRLLNDVPNRRRYKLRNANCADFAGDVLSVVMPGVFHRNVLADFGMMTPKQLAREFDAYGQAHPELHFAVYELPQLPGSVRRSRPVRGAAESLITTKRYFAVVVLLQPEVMLANWIIYEKKGKWIPGLDANTISPETWEVAFAKNRFSTSVSGMPAADNEER